MVQVQLHKLQVICELVARVSFNDCRARDQESVRTLHFMKMGSVSYFTAFSVFLDDVLRTPDSTNRYSVDRSILTIFEGRIGENKQITLALLMSRSRVTTWGHIGATSTSSSRVQQETVFHDNLEPSAPFKSNLRYKSSAQAVTGYCYERLFDQGWCWRYLHLSV